MSKADQLRARAARAANRRPDPEPEYSHHPDQTSLLDDGEPAPAPAHAAPAPARRRPSTAPRTKPVRITVDLSPLAYRDLNRWCRQAAEDLDVAKVNTAAVVRTLLGMLDDDQALAGRVRDRIAADPSGYGTQ